jgi:hypothetical protein
MCFANTGPSSSSSPGCRHRPDAPPGRRDRLGGAPNVNEFRILQSDVTPEKLRGYDGALFGWKFDTSSPVSEAVSEPMNYGFVEKVPARTIATMIAEQLSLADMKNRTTGRLLSVNIQVPSCRVRGSVSFRMYMSAG